MSKLPTPSSRIKCPQPTRLRTPGSAMKRQASGAELPGSPEKKTRLSASSIGSTDSEDSVPDMPPPARRGLTRQPTAPAGKLRRSVSMASLPVSGLRERNGSKTNLARSKIGASTLNLTGRASNITPATAARTLAGKAPARRPGTNITNQVNSRSAAVTKSTGTGLSKSSVGGTKPGGDTGKSKRPPWDLKGRLQDMETLVKSSAEERENLMQKFMDYDLRIESLELEKRSLNQNLEKTQSVSQATQGEVDRLSTNLRNEQDGRSADKRRYESTIQDLEFNKATLERQIKTLESELSARQDELAGLKSTVSHLTSAHAGIEAQLSSTKIMLDDRNKRVSELESQVATQKDTIEDMEKKLRDGENIRRKLHNTVLELKGNIRVFCRVRPLLGEEIKGNGDSDVIHHISFVDEKTLELCKGGDPNSSTMSGLKGRGGGAIEFNYDRVFNPTSSQAEVFEEISQLAQSALDGYNVCVFAYGQTGSGKTFTMEGIHGDETLEGMIPRTVKHIFKSMKDLEDKGWRYKVEASFLEIYNETIRDLLATPKESKNLTYDVKLVDSKKNDTFVTNLKVVEVENESRVHHLLTLAQQQRAVAATNMNERSSRSHSVFRLKLTGHNSKTLECCEGNLNLVDLAGSERLKESGSEGARLTETQNINKSLSNLGNVIMALGQKQSHIPYRNSKLTHLLQNSLGGNSKTLMFVNVSPLEMCFGETLNSLRFATKVNQCHIGTATKQIRK
ncbi:carboxy-terminal kinesin 2-like isoform X2 [Penaeus japonicus]|uniref:carboxy-terminal kinesin 2-like isoform X2 n=1 Tax=Penaeus japonicus TaxID=27405 RepID=UPI001C710C6D|nr:carboxy-terminal kinesin 2-like isoform X2 [Penaeus japonicus]